MANDSDLDGDALSIVSVQDAVNGTVAMGRHVVFTPTANYNGPASFTYTISDGTATQHGDGERHRQPGQRPAGGGERQATVKKTRPTLTAATLLANDTDLDGNPLSIISVQARPTARWR